MDSGKARSHRDGGGLSAFRIRSRQIFGLLPPLFDSLSRPAIGGAAVIMLEAGQGILWNVPVVCATVYLYNMGEQSPSGDRERMNQMKKTNHPIRRSLCLLLALVMVLGMLPGVRAAGEEPAPAGTYYVAGVAALCGSEWNEADPDNLMTWNGETGLFEKVYADVAVGTYQFKVTDGTWNNAWGKDGQNYTFQVSAVCDVTVTFDPDTKAVNAKGDGVGAVTGIEITSITAVGGGKGNFLNGKSWDVAAAANHMTASGSVYTITYENVAAGTYEVKFAANDSFIIRNNFILIIITYIFPKLIFRK